jgi:hypothetical protein
LQQGIQHAAVVILQQVLITRLQAGTGWPVLFKINRLGASRKLRLGVAVLAQGTTMRGELRLDPKLS